MKFYFDGNYEGERALYNTNDAVIVNCRFHDGESHLKESSDLEIRMSSFEWKYPLWYCSNVKVRDSFFALMSRSGIWYTENIEMINCTFECPKTFRRAKNITLKDVIFLDANEMFWNCEGINISNMKADNGDYMFFNAKDIEIDNLYLDGNYCFDGASNIKVSNSTLLSKDSFWNVENAYTTNTKIVGEYIGWNSKNLTFIDCDIESEQGFCYIKGLTLKNCTLKGTNLSFELCEDIDVEVKGHIVSIKNPISGRIVCDSVGEIILDKALIDPSKTEIIVGGKRYEI
ncbi:MAG: DUF3737 family protein [Bacilli bacterium]|nr:DUF3737 family protein [Bacilli bacterium]